MISAARRGFGVILTCLFCAGVARADDSESNLDLKVYGNADFGVSTAQMANPQFAATTVHNSFAAAALDIFPTYSRDRLSFLAELMIEGHSDNSIGVDLERVQVAYLFAEWLRLRVGRAHTAFGYYGDSYHHGRIFDLTTSRPYFIGFEDSGGLLMAHTVGIGLEGAFKSKLVDIRYDFDVGNGRPSDPTAVPVLYALQDQKQLNLRLRFMPRFLDGLIVGGNIQYVPIGASPANPAVGTVVLAHPLNEYDVGVHIAYMEHHLHLIVEGAMMSRRDTVTRIEYRHYLGFFEGGYRIGAFTPYVRIEGAAFDESGDPYLANETFASNMATSSWAGTSHFGDLRLGTRWDALENLVFKLEYRHFASNVASGFPSFDGAVAQAAFGF
jgi:hypothetical protein